MERNVLHYTFARGGEIVSRGASALWTLARIAGHSSIAMSTRYVHPSEDAVFTAMERLGGHKIGHTTETVNSERSTRNRLPS